MTAPIEADSRKPSSGLLLWDDAPPPWKAAMKERCLITEVSNLMDSRDITELKLGDSSFEVQFKYQGPKVDVAYLASASSFVIRIAGLYHWEDDGSGSNDYVEMPAFCFEVPADQFLFLSSQDHYCATLEECRSFDEADSKTPLSFTMVKEKGVSQPGVRIVKPGKKEAL